MANVKKVGGAAGAICAVASVIAVVISNGNVRTNERGLELIGNAEACRRDPYVCPAGVLTNGIGNTHDVQPGVRLSDEQIAKDWERNIKVAEQCIDRYFRGKEMLNNTFSAMTSAAFNMGCYSLRFYGSPAKETTIHRMAAQRNWKQMCERLPDFVNAGGVKLPGLVTRRNNERALCLDGLK
ncbi:lysozyme [Pantoea sp. PNT02]|uniref:lysozyme n=1 Tax=Pantoea sp. PNT02 TaxID=2769261 RepID=UPI001781D066|nr:lysozyme [Pantoea sp. PNT02]MBD9645147.1 lysozyme [Pantoea sp. PNT02]